MPEKRRVEQLDGVLVTALGCRQGCRCGPVVSNLAFTVATREVQEAIAPLGMTLHVPNPHVTISWAYDVIICGYCAVA